jgi:hypothetical protein
MNYTNTIKYCFIVLIRACLKNQVHKLQKLLDEYAMISKLLIVLVEGHQELEVLAEGTCS